jgi:hypothetical protein
VYQKGDALGQQLRRTEAGRSANELLIVSPISINRIADKH